MRVSGPSALGLVVTLLLPCLSSPAAETGKRQYPAVGAVERLDPRFDRLIPVGAQIEKLAEGFQWTEGPVWLGSSRQLLFSDIPQNAILAWSEKQGTSVFLKPAGYTGKEPRGGESGTNGLLLDREGRLVMCQHGDRRIVRVEKDRSWTTLADRYRGKRFNSPNDAIYKSNGDLYFTDPPYGLPQGAEDPSRELSFCGVYRRSVDGEVTLLTDQLTRPNGIGFSPDEKTLYVAQSDPQKAVWMAFEVKPDGTLGSGRVFLDATPWVKAKLPGLPDGLKVDARGNLFATGPGGVNVLAPDGTLLGRLATGQPTANCRFGDDGAMLYMTVNHWLCRIRTTTKGLEF